MLRTLLVSTLLIFTGSASAQSTFSLEYHGGNGDEAVEVVENASGDLVVLGYVFTTNNSDLVVSVVSQSGVLQQSLTFGTAEYELPKSITATSDGGYFITGSIFNSPSDYDLLLVKLDSSFNTVFRKRFSIVGANENGNRGFEVAPGLYGVAGSIGLGGSTKPSYIIVDDNGDVRHQAYLSTNQFASPNFSGRYMGNGVTALVHLTNAFTLLDSSGTVAGNCATNIGLFTTDVLRTISGNYACVAASDYGAPLGGSLSFAFIDSNLTSWSGGFKLKINIHDLVPVAMTQDGAGNLYIAANATSLSTGNTFPLLLKTTSSGNLLWSRNYLPAGAPSAAFRQLRIAADGGILLCGNSGPWNNQRLYVVKADTAGTAPCNWAPYTLSPLAVSAVGQTLHTPVTGTLPPSATLTGNPSAVALVTDALCTSGTTGGFEQGPRPLRLQVLPTWIDEGFRIETELPGRMTIDVINTEGRLLARATAASGESIQIENWSPGVYTLRISFTTGEMFVRRVIRK